MLRRSLLTLAGLLVAGVLRLPLETALTEEQRAAGFHPARVGLDLRERLGQTGFLAALSGCRAVVADLLCIQAYSAWERVEWGRMNWLFETATSLQPRALFIWEMASWHMGYNASRAAREDQALKLEAQRRRAERQYLEISRAYLQRGLVALPTEPKLYELLGTLERDKFNDPLAASVAYAQGAALPGAKGYLRRFSAYCLAQVPGREVEAHARLRALYDLGPQEHLPTLLKELRRLEEKLALPSEQRIYKER